MKLLNERIPAVIPFSKALRNLRTIERVCTRTFQWASKARKVKRPPDSPVPPLLARHMRDWANETLARVNVRTRLVGTPSLDEPVLLVGNHVSYLDIVVLMSQLPVVFVSKKEIAAWPVFGAAAKSIGTLFFERESKDSRGNVAESIAHCLHVRRQSVALFPGGTTTMDESPAWRYGPFRIAKEKNIRVQPFRLKYEPMRTAAYLMEDVFLPHLWKLVDSDGVVVTVEFHEPVTVESPEADAETWRSWTREILS